MSRPVKLKRIETALLGVVNDFDGGGSRFNRHPAQPECQFNDRGIVGAQELDELGIGMARLSWGLPRLQQILSAGTRPADKSILEHRNGAPE